MEYSVLVRDVEDEMVQFCEKEGITLTAYSPLARGELFSGRYETMRQHLEYVGRKHGKTATQVALNYLIRHKPVVVIPKAANKSHVLENIGSMGFTISDADAESIGSIRNIRSRKLAGRFASLFLKHTSAWAAAVQK